MNQRGAESDAWWDPQAVGAGAKTKVAPPRRVLLGMCTARLGPSHVMVSPQPFLLSGGTPKDIKLSCYSYSRFRFGRGWGSGDWS